MYVLAGAAFITSLVRIREVSLEGELEIEQGLKYDSKKSNKAVFISL